MDDKKEVDIVEETCQQLRKYTGAELYGTYGTMSIYHHWWFTDYATDIAEHLYDKEKLRPAFTGQSPQISLRNVLITLICDVAEQKCLNITCVHVAVFLLDIFMDNHNIAIERLKLVALVCLLLGAKLEDSDNKVPKMSELNSIINNQYPLRDYISVEIMVMEFFSFDIAMLTYSHFVEYFIFLTVNEMDFELVKKDTDQYVDYNHFKYVAQDIVFEFMDACLKDLDIVHAVPSQIGSAIIYATRKHLKVTPTWTNALKHMTAYLESDIESYADKMKQLREFNLRKRKFVSSHESIYELENYPEYTPKRMKVQYGDKSFFLKPDEAQK